MEISKLKENIIKQVNLLKEDELPEFYGIVINYISGKSDISEWDKLSDFEKEGILLGISEIDRGLTVHHNEVMKKYNSKYSNA